MSYLDRIKECTKLKLSKYAPFYCENIQIGNIHIDFLVHLRKFPETLVIRDGRTYLQPKLNTFALRSQAMSEIANELRANNLIKGWRNEKYPIGPSFYSQPLFEIERAAVPVFGSKGYGVHLNGYIKKNGVVFMWVGKRSVSKPTGPGKFDQIVAGGQPIGISLLDNLIKECAEEAAIQSNLAKQAKAVGAISYKTERNEGLRDDTLFCFDLQLPNYFKPINSDGEVEKFFLWPIEEVSNLIKKTQKFKFNSALVVIDFLVRHGFIKADEINYADIISGLHQ